MHPRLLAPTLRRVLGQFPAILLLGPRQSGKTTLLRTLLGDSLAYHSFDDPGERTLALADPNAFLDRFGDRTLALDEIQSCPEILPYLKVRIDADRQRNGRFVLTGSQQFAVMAHLNETLAGRMAILELLPFSQLEYPAPRPLEAAVLDGFYPEPSLHPEKRELWVRSYIQTYVERDIRMLANIANLRAFDVFIGLAAARHGQIVNHADLAREAGVSQPTARSWLRLLEASFVVVLVPPAERNYGKRVTRAPRLYFLDPALVCDYTRLPSGEAALRGPLGGALFEGMVAAEILKVHASHGKRAPLRFWRSHDGLEVDFLLEVAGKTVPIEVKLTATPTPHHLEPIERWKKLAGADAAAEGLLVCRVPRETPLPFGNRALPFDELGRWLEARLST